MSPRQNETSRLFAQAMSVGESLSQYEEKLAELRRHYLAVLQTWHQAFELEHETPTDSEPDWPAQLRELAEKLMHVPVDVAGTDQAHVDLLLSVATYLESAQAKPAGAEMEAAGVQVVEARNVVAQALAGAEERRSRAIRVDATPEDERHSE